MKLHFDNLIVNVTKIKNQYRPRISTYNPEFLGLHELEIFSESDDLASWEPHWVNKYQMFEETLDLDHPTIVIFNILQIVFKYKGYVFGGFIKNIFAQM